MKDKKLRLPKTEFPMQANLVSLEPKIHEYWNSINLYDLLNKKKAKPFACHFGPPFANGDPHCGHGLSYTIKSIILVIQTMNGFKVSNILGWDCHGLPIELKVKDMKITDKKDFYLECQNVAKRWIEVQKPILKLLCFIHDDKNYYSTMKSLSSIYKAFSDLLLKGRVFLSNRPLIWSTEYKCNIPSIDIEYQDKHSTAIYVLFKIHNTNNRYALIYTTTPWSLVDNMAICINKNLDYSIVVYDNKEILIQTNCIQNLSDKMKCQFTILEHLQGKDILCMKYDNFINNKVMYFIHGDHVNVEGTGLVHTAPAHGIEDYEAFYSYYSDKIIDQVSEDGFIQINEERISVFESEKIINKFNTHIMFVEKILHNYPFYKGKPLIYKTSEQVYLKIDDLKDKIIKNLEDIITSPLSLKDSMINAINNRDNWCLSRNRIYGTPLAIFINKDNKELLINDVLQGKIIKQMENDPTFFLSEDCVQILHGIVEDPHMYRPYLGVLDCWFESACVSSVILSEFNQNDVADIYTEGKDQIRGWFNASAFLSMSIKNNIPYKSLVANGFVVDDNGDKLSKSKGNAIPFQNIINQYGLDVFTILVASSDFKDDVKIGHRMLSLASDQYRKIRNVLRYLISVVEYEKSIKKQDITETLEKAILSKLRGIYIKYKEYTEKFEIHMAFNLVKDFIVYISELYFNARKDCLYSDGNTKRRSEVIYTMFLLLKGFLILLCPFIPRTCEEIFIYLNDRGYFNLQSVFLLNFDDFFFNLKECEDEEIRLDTITTHILPWVNAAIDGMKKNKEIRKNEEIGVLTKTYDNMIKLIVNCSEVVHSAENNVYIVDKKSCMRCGQRTGLDLCERCEYFFINENI